MRVSVVWEGPSKQDRMQSPECDPSTPRLILFSSSDKNDYCVRPDCVSYVAPRIFYGHTSSCSYMLRNSSGYCEPCCWPEELREVWNVSESVALHCCVWENALDQIQDVFAQLLAGILWRCAKTCVEGLGKACGHGHIHKVLIMDVREDSELSERPALPLRRRGVERPGCCFLSRVPHEVSRAWRLPVG